MEMIGLSLREKALLTLHVSEQKKQVRRETKLVLLVSLKDVKHALMISHYETLEACISSLSIFVYNVLLYNNPINSYS